MRQNTIALTVSRIVFSLNKNPFDNLKDTHTANHTFDICYPDHFSCGMVTICPLKLNTFELMQENESCEVCGTKMI